VIPRIDELLELTYRSADLGNFADPLDEAVYILLSRQTREAVYQRVFAELKDRWQDWDKVLRARPTTIETVLRPVGLHRQRAAQLRELLQHVRAEARARNYGDKVSLAWLHELDDEEAEAALLAMPGIGPKSARCIMSYSLGRHSFAVDTHVRRVFTRLELVPDGPRKPDHSAYEALVPPAARSRLHINLVHHGREICRNRNPRCDECPLVSFCPLGRSRAGAYDDRPVAIDLFSGGGGLGSGFKQGGFRVALAVEADRAAAQSYRLNHPGCVVLETDVRNVTAARIKAICPGAMRPNAILAGPPCQGYSHAGNRDPDDSKNVLYRQVVRLARELRPRFVMIENVPGMKGVGGVTFAPRVLGSLREAGYAVREHLLVASWFGVPQLRERYFYLAQRADLGIAPDAPTPTHTPDAQKYSASIRKTPTVLEVLEGLPLLGPGVDAEHCEVDGFVLHNGGTMSHSKEVIAKIRRVTAGKGPISYRRLHPDQARTIVAGHRALPVHPFLHRTISVREAARIQGFPDDYIFAGYRSQQPLQVANAVPPPVAAAVARKFIEIASMGRGDLDGGIDAGVKRRSA
jgi:DNA (cytosine-5)-methyltransferase 1